MATENKISYYYVKFLEPMDWRGFYVREVYSTNSLELAILKKEEVVFYPSENEAQKAADFSNELYQFNNN